MTDNNNNNGRDLSRHAASALANVSPAHAAAMTELWETDPQTLAGIVTMVRASGCDAEVGAYAVVIAPRMWLDRRNGAPLLAVVRGAIRKAERTVALASWDSYGDMTDAMALADGGARTILSHDGTAPADSQYGVTYGDVVATAAGMVGGDAGATLADAGRAYVRLRRQYDVEGTGRPVALAGALAAAAGVGPDDSAYHAARRRTVAAVKRVNRSAVLAVTGAPMARPSYGGNRVSGGNGTQTPAHPTEVIPPRAGRYVPAATVTRVRTRTVGYVRTDAPMAGASDVVVWDGTAVREVPVRAARANGWPMVDVLGYDSRHGYAPLATVRTAPLFRAVRENVTEVTEVPAVTVGARPAMLPPAMVWTRAPGEALAIRRMTETETEVAAAPDARRVPMVESGDAASARPDDSPLGGDVTTAGILKSYKPVVSPRARSGGSTGPTVPATLAR